MYTCTCTGGTRVSREITTAYVCWAPTSIRYAGRKGCTLYTHTRGSFTCCPLTSIMVCVPIRKPQSCPMQEITLRLWLFLIFYSMYTCTSRGRGDPREIATAYACWAPSSIPINAGAGWRSCTLYPLTTVIMVYTYSIMLCVVLLTYIASHVDLWFGPLHVPWVTTHRGRCRQILTPRDSILQQVMSTLAK